MPLAPWLPPTIRRTGRSVFKPSAARQAAGGCGMNCERTGVPVVVTR